MTSATFAPDDKTIVTASRDGTARIYLTQIKDLIALVLTRVGRGPLTCEERQRYLNKEIDCSQVTLTPNASPTP